MNIPVSGQEMCDECGRTVAKIWRTCKDHKYCGTCYARVFKRRMCPRCGNFARLPKSDPNAVCRKCEIDKPCIRCGRTKYKVGKITPYGPVCNSCLPYFGEPKPCESCGRLSTRLSRLKRLGHELKVCPKCVRADYKSCEACHRHRLLEESADGQMLCKACREGGEIPCPQCSRPMPAGRGDKCEDCYWSGLLEKRVAIDCSAFSVPEMSERFRTFGKWLGEEVGAQKAAITVHRYLTFFMEIERQWKAVPEYGDLLSRFGAARLRRVLLPMRWLQHAGLILTNAKTREEDSDMRRIAATLDRVGKGTPERTLLENFYKELMADREDGVTTTRSIRLAMTPAAALLLKAREMERMPPDQEVLDAYLAKTPGQRAAISGFVCFLREKHKIEIALPKADREKALKRRKKKLEGEMLTLMREGGEGEEFWRRWISVALAYFHGLPKKIGRTIGLEEVATNEDGSFSVRCNGHIYWVPRQDMYWAAR